LRIAIVRLSALGDIVNSLFILDAIKARYSDAQIEWITEEAFAPLLRRHPLIDAVHTVAIKKAKKERSFAMLRETVRGLRALGSFDRIIDLQGLVKSAVVARLIGPTVHGFDRESLREGAAAWLYRATSHIPYRENAMLRTAKITSDALGFVLDRDAILQKPSAFPLEPLAEPLQTLFDPQQPNIILTLGSSWASKVWPTEHFAALCELLETNLILVWGNEAEQTMADAIHAAVPATRIAPKLDLYELMQLIGHADLVIGNDSGPTHMAWAMNRPSITLFGPTPAYKMMFETPINRAIESPSKVDPLRLNRNDRSIREITPESVAAAARELLAQSRA
jgi:heptosyltransferase I